MQSEGHLQIGTTSLPKSFHPLKSMAIDAHYMMGFALRPLTGYDHKNQLVCLVCKDLPIIEIHKVKGKDTAIVTMTLRDLSWADGQKVTADDILFTWKIASDPKISSHLYPFMHDDIIDIQKISDHQVKIKRVLNLHHPADLSDFWLLPAHIEAPIYKAYPNDYFQYSTYHRNPTHPGLYFGPYHVTAFDPFGKVVYSQNPYWLDKNALPYKSLSLSAAGDQNALLMKYKARQLDMIPAIANLSHLRLSPHVSEETSNLQSISAIGQEMIMINHRSDLMNDVLFRRALYAAIDKNLINQKLFHGQKRIATSFLAPSEPFYLEAENNYNIAKAIVLLKQSQYKSGTSVDMVFLAGNSERKALAEALQDMWHKIGVKVNLIMQPPRLFFGKTLKERDFKHFLLIGWPKTPDYIPLPMLGSNFMPEKENHYIGYNYGGYQSAEMDRILKTLTANLLETERQDHWHQFETLFQQDLPFFPLFHLSKAAIIPKNLKELHLLPHYYPDSFFIEK